MHLLDWKSQLFANMKKVSLAILAALLMVFPVKVAAQEYDTPVVAPEILTVPETTETVTVAEETPAETKKKEKKVKEKKVKEVKVKEVKEKKAPHYGLCNHLGVGVGGGVLDGISGMVGLPLGGHFQIRGSYSVGVPDQVYPLQYQVPDLGTFDVSGRDVHMTDIVCRAELTKNLNAFLDLYPSKRGSFHLTVGIGGLLSGDIFGLSADLSTPLRDTFGEDQKLSDLFIELNDDEATDPAKKQIRISTDENGVLHLTARDKQSQFRPYFGIGWGRVASIRSFITMTLDIGVQKVNGIELVGYNYDGEPQVFTSGLVQHKDNLGTLPVVGNMDNLIDKLASGEIIKGFTPVVRLGLNIRLF